LIRWLRKRCNSLSNNHPVPGEDAQWIALCDACQEMTLHVTRGGFYNGGIDHCYTCGKEKELTGFRQDDIDRMKTSCWCHWQKYPLCPYNWHQQTEEQKLNILKGR